MSKVTQILNAIGRGELDADGQLIPLVYAELRTLAARHLARESPGQTLTATALVHEAYLRLIGPEQTLDFENRSHFFGAAAEAMRRILIENARRKNARKRGGDWDRITLDPEAASVAPARSTDDILALDEALKSLAAEDPKKAELVKLRFFAGLTLAQAAEALQISDNTASRWWAYAKAFLYDDIAGPD